MATAYYGEQLLGTMGSIVSSAQAVLYVTNPTFETNGTQPADADYAPVSLSGSVAFHGSDGVDAYELEVYDDLVFGTSGAATGYTITGIGLISVGGDTYVWIPWNQEINVGEIPRIPANELWVILR